jgi:hypothetical protein
MSLTRKVQRCMKGGLRGAEMITLIAANIFVFGGSSVDKSVSSFFDLHIPA